MKTQPPSRPDPSLKSNPSDLTLDEMFNRAAIAFRLKPENRALVAEGSNFISTEDMPPSPIDKPSDFDKIDNSPEAVHERIFQQDDITETVNYNGVWEHLGDYSDEDAPAAVFNAVAQHFGNPETLDTIWNETMFKVPLDNRLNSALRARKLSEYDIKFKNRYNDDSFYEKESVPEPFIQWPMKSSKTHSKNKVVEIFDYSD